jgi:hypothetical protein
MHLRLFSVRHLLLTRQNASRELRTLRDDDGLPALGLRGNHSHVIRAQKIA